MPVCYPPFFVAILQTAWNDSSKSLNKISEENNIVKPTLLKLAKEKGWPSRTYNTNYGKKSIDIDRFKIAWLEGGSKKEIAVKCGLSEGYVNALAAKLKLPRRTRDGNDTKKRLIIKPTKHQKTQFCFRNSVDLENINPFEFGKTSLLKVREFECHAPTGGNHKDGTANYCGDHVFKGAYCEKHYNRFYIQPDT
jgi:hypothetical protein